MGRRAADSHSPISQQSFLWGEPVTSSITFLNNKPLRQPRLCKGITRINLLGTKRMRVGTTTRKYKPISAINGPHAHKSSLKLLVNNWPGSQEPVGRK
jgi:hypothetical protein